MWFGQLPRRKILRAGVAVGSALGLGLWGTPTGEGSTDTGAWPRHRNDSACTGSTSAEGVPVTDDKVGFGWEQDGEPGSYSAPIVGDGFVYTSEMGWVRARDASDGELLWETELNDFAHSSVALGSGTVYVGDRSGTVTALSGSDGSVQWEATGFNFWYVPPMTFVDGDVYFGDNEGLMYSLDGNTGEINWEVSVTNGEFMNAPAIADGTLYIGSYNPNHSGVYAFDTESGAEEWFFETALEVPTMPAVADGTVYVSEAERAPSDGALLALSASSGRKEWRFDGLETLGSPSVDDSRVYVVDGMQIKAFDAQTGSQEWWHDTGTARIGRRNQGPVVANDIVYASTSSDSGLYALDAESGEVIWNRELPVHAPLSVVGERVYAKESEASSERGRLWAIEAGGTRRPQARFEIEDKQPRVGISTRFNASESFDPDGEVVRYEWDVTGDGTTDYTGERIEHTFDDPESHEITLKVSNDEGFSAIATKELAVSEALDLTIDITPEEPTTEDEITFRPSVNRFSTYEWNLGDGTVETGREITHEYDTADEYTIRLNLTDPSGSITTTVDIEPGPPSATFDVTPSDPDVDEELVFSADENDGSSYEWDFGDGNSNTGKTVEHSYEEPGVYEIRLSIENAAGEAADSEEIPVGDLAARIWSGTSDDTVYTAVGASAITALGAGGGYALLRRSRRDELKEDDTDEAEPELDDLRLEEILTRATEARSQAETYWDENDIQRAVDRYSEAVDAYRVAREQVPKDDDRYQNIESEIEQTQTDYRPVQELYTDREELRETLIEAEGNFHTAIAAHVQKRPTLSKMYYRKARESFDTALKTVDKTDADLFADSLEVDTEFEGEHPPTNLAELPHLDNAALERLSNEGLDSLGDLHDDNSETIENLVTNGDIATDLQDRLIALSWWSEPPTTFEGQEKVARRREQAAEGYQRIL